MAAASIDLNLNERNGARFQRQAETVLATQAVFLDACRQDLSSSTKRWQLQRRRKERRFLQQAASR
jgi:hypothetical protein